MWGALLSSALVLAGVWLPPPPPPPNAPGAGCSGEAIFYAQTGSHTVVFDTSSSETLSCTFVLHTQAPGLAISFDAFDLQAGSTCRSNKANVRIFDGTLVHGKMLAIFSCESSQPVASTTGNAMLRFTARESQAGNFTFRWAPVNASCGNGVCENSADEYDTCMADCEGSPMPSISSHWSDTKNCEEFDSLTATTSSGQVAQMPYTVAHFGRQLPPGGLRLDLARTHPDDACSALSSVTEGGDVSSVIDPSLLNGTAYLSSVYSCHFIDKAVHVEAAGGTLAVVGHAANSLFYMAAAEARQADSRALDIPSILIGSSNRSWLLNKLSGGVVLEIGVGEQRCSGGKMLTAPSGFLTDGPADKKYCSMQACSWHIAIPTDDIIVLSFSRLDMECITPGTDPYDYLEIHDGVTAAAPLLATLLCELSQTAAATAPIVSTGPHMFLDFVTDGGLHFYGFDATYTTGQLYCAAFETCGTCATAPECAWCRSAQGCLPATGAQAVCEDDAWSYNVTDCCPYSYAGTYCDLCADDFYGPECDECSCGAGGTCNDTLAGDGTCMCDVGWSVASQCHECSPDFWGPGCESCDCGDNASCDEGINGTGCECNPGHFGEMCTPCSCVTNSSHHFALCADGMAGDGTCSCKPGFTNIAIGCAECEPARFGMACEECNCPEGTHCAEGLHNTGVCSCAGEACEGDASLDFFAVVVRDFLDERTASEHAPLVPAFTPEHLSYGETILESESSAFEITVATAQWGAAFEVYATTPDTTTLVCNVSVDPNGPVAIGARNASHALTLLDDVANPATLPVMGAASTRLVRSCPLALTTGTASLTIHVTSPSRLVERVYSMQLTVPPSSDCRLASLNLSYADEAEPPTHLSTMRPDFSPAVTTYYAALNATQLVVNASVIRHLQCMAVDDPLRCLQPLLLRTWLVDADGATTYDSGYTHEDALFETLSPPLGSSKLVIQVLPESRGTPYEPAHNACTYNVSIARGLSADVSVENVTFLLPDGSAVHLPVGSLGAPAGATGAESLVSRAMTNVSIAVDNAVSSIDLLPEGTPPGVTYVLSCEQCDDLPVGQTVAHLRVIAEDGVHSSLITIYIYKYPSDDCTLESVRVFKASSAAATRPSNSNPLLTWSPPDDDGVYTTSVANSVLWVLVEVVASSAESVTAYQWTTDVGSSTYKDFNADGVSSSIAVPIQDLTINLQVVAESGRMCTHTLSIERLESTDATIGRLSAYEWSNALSNGPSLAVRTTSCAVSRRDGTTIDKCYQVSFAHDISEIFVVAESSHSIFCDSASHACTTKSRMQIIAPGASVGFPVSNKRGLKGEMNAKLTVEPGVTEVSLVTTAAAGGLNRRTTLLYVDRALSDDTRLRLIDVLPASCPMCILFHQDSIARDFDVEMLEGHTTLTVRAEVVYDSGASAALDGLSLPREVPILEERSTLTIQVTAADGETTSAYILHVYCPDCVGDESQLTSDFDGSLNPSEWLLMVLLVAAVTLCCLSLIVCVRMHFLRMRHETLAHVRQPAAPMLSPQEVLRRLSPHIKEVKCKVEDPYCDDACSICLGDFEAEEELCILPCKHPFHKECIHGWLVHRGLTAQCPLCKRPVATLLASRVPPPAALPPPSEVEMAIFSPARQAPVLPGARATDLDSDSLDDAGHGSSGAPDAPHAPSASSNASRRAPAWAGEPLGLQASGRQAEAPLAAQPPVRALSRPVAPLEFHPVVPQRRWSPNASRIAPAPGEEPLPGSARADAPDNLSDSDDFSDDGGSTQRSDVSVFDRIGNFAQMLLTPDTSPRAAEAPSSSAAGPVVAPGASSAAAGPVATPAASSAAQPLDSVES